MYYTETFGNFAFITCGNFDVSMTFNIAIAANRFGQILTFWHNSSTAGSEISKSSFIICHLCIAGHRPQPFVSSVAAHSVARPAVRPTSTLLDVGPLLLCSS